MNEAAKAMLHQILKMNSSPRLEPSMNNSGPLLIGNHPSSNGLDSGSSSTRMSGVMLSEVPTASGPSYLPMETGFPASHSTTAISEVQSPASVATDYVKTDYTAEMGMHNSGQNTILPNFTAMTGIVPGGSAGGPNMNIAGSEKGNAEFFDTMSSVLDAPVPIETEALSPSQDEEVFLDGNHKLPGINDVFWEQFLTASPLNGETDEINSSSPESSMSKEQELQSWQDNGWDNIQHMNRLAEQMGLLTPESLKG
jgi:heat shock transcription factor